MICSKNIRLRCEQLLHCPVDFDVTDSRSCILTGTICSSKQNGILNDQLIGEVLISPVVSSPSNAEYFGIF